MTRAKANPVVENITVGVCLSHVHSYHSFKVFLLSVGLKCPEFVHLVI
ncbi:Uncharacterised protein [BD1-7 clade bacterium]|uniref:Uncharacterized protein n=1 Tax=BD1-7 clade bacterium TaxID=2029982 RepID=A0A5S9QZE2_9GAMM|nr:Uncharacterised protein [BD1-7 clade bacterium]